MLRRRSAERHGPAAEKRQVRDETDQLCENTRDHCRARARADAQQGDVDDPLIDWLIGRRRLDGGERGSDRRSYRDAIGRCECRVG